MQKLLRINNIFPQVNRYDVDELETNDKKILKQ
jgi:hypothetical protein